MHVEIVILIIIQDKVTEVLDLTNMKCLLGRSPNDNKEVVVAILFCGRGAHHLNSLNYGTRILHLVV